VSLEFGEPGTFHTTNRTQGMNGQLSLEILSPKQGDWLVYVGPAYDGAYVTWNLTLAWTSSTPITSLDVKPSSSDQCATVEASARSPPAWAPVQAWR
jgi:hypothetical protein